MSEYLYTVNKLNSNNIPKQISRSDFYTKKLQINEGQIYFGGVPKSLRIPRNAVASTESFVGCISDVTIGRTLINFANYTDRQNAQLDQCGADVFDETIAIAPTDTRSEHINEIDVEQPTTKEQDELEQDRLAAAEVEATRQANEKRIAEEKRQKAEFAAAAEEELRKERRRQHKEEKRLREEAERNRAGANELNPTDEVSAAATPKPPPPSERPKFNRPVYDEPDEPVCKLPATPNLDVDFNAGYRFGVNSESRVEFMQIASKIKKSYEISLKFRTTESDGVLFYAAGSDHTDFIALYLQNGRVHHVFKIDTSLASIVSRYEYANNEWHTVVITRQLTHGRLIINGEDIEEGEAPATTRMMGVQAPFFFGGISSDYRKNMQQNLALNGEYQFRGCITDMQIGGKDLGIPAQFPGVIPCSKHVEAGVFIGPGDGFVKLRDRFRVGNHTNIELEIRPRTTNALLMSVHGKKAFLILELIDGTVQLSANDGEQVYKTIWEPNDEENLCDGNWHSIKVIKSKFVITLQVDSVSTNPGMGLANKYESDTKRPLYLGGHQHLQRARQLTVRKPYIGCIRNVRINDGEVEVITNDMVTGNVQTGLCPTN